MLRIVLVLCLASFACAQQTGPLSEAQLYANVGNYDQFAVGYDTDKGGKVERIDEPVHEMPQINEVQAGQDQVFDKQFPDDVRQNRVDNKKELHTYTTQQKVVTVNNNNLYRYLKKLMVNSEIHTNLQKINHAKLNNLLITNLQETHQPKLIVQLSRTDTVSQMQDVNEQPIVENARKDNILPPKVFPATVEKLGYGGQVIPMRAGLASGRSGLNIDVVDQQPLVNTDSVAVASSDIGRGDIDGFRGRFFQRNL